MGSNHYFLEVVFCGTLLMMLAKKHQHYDVSKRGYMTEQDQDARVTYFANLYIPYFLKQKPHLR